jgi:ArsR family transcriptional regulator, virulence genes transcriptional regulator
LIAVPADAKLLSMAEFTAQAAVVAGLLKALANEKRLLILCSLIDAKQMTVADLAAVAELSQSALSQHLARLREQNIVSFKRVGASLYYSVSDPRVKRILKTLKSIYC